MPILIEEPIDPSKLRRRDLLSTGSTLLNLACSGNPHGGFLKGKYFFLVGDSDSGKTFFSMTCLAEAVHDLHFKNYRKIYDNAEDGMNIDLSRFFGPVLSKQLEPPSKDKDGDPRYSTTVEEFYFHLEDAFQKGEPFIYILDSMDSLDTAADDKKFDQHRKAHNKKQKREADADDSEAGPEEKVTGSYGTAKAKMNSEYMRKAKKKLRKSGSILIVISQTRDNINPMSYDKKTRAGGRALRFYSTVEIWTSIAMKIRKKVHEKLRTVGNLIRLEIKKNHINGWLGDVETTIYPSYGIDDVGSMVDYLIDEGYWKQSKQTITAKGLGLVGTREKLIRIIEKRGKESELRDVCGVCWKEVQDACALKRKPRYGMAAPVEQE